MEETSEPQSKPKRNDRPDLRAEVETLKLAQAVQAATFAGAQATQAAVTAGASATTAAATAGLWSAMAAGFVALVVGLFIGANVRNS